MRPYFCRLYLLACLAACTFDATGRPMSGQVSGPAGTSESTAPAPTTGVDPPTSTGDLSTDAATTGSQALTTASGGEMTTVEPAAVCGDGIVEGDEQCDEGLEENSDANLCTSTCQDARCGDGHVQVVSGEACDDGELNEANPGYNQCALDCTRGPHCGDGVVQMGNGEECEPQEIRGELDTCAATCVYEPRYVFLSSLAVSGDLGGMAGADQLCNQLVADSPLTGTFRAWLLVDGQTLADRFPEMSGLQISWNFRNVHGDVLAKSFDDLVKLGPASSLVYTEHGDVVSEASVWTNITSAGEAAGGDCAQWTSEEGPSALVGHSGFFPDVGAEAQQWHVERRWTDRDGVKRACKSSTFHLYCMQVGD